jgi:phosphatidylserine/phosphatidylglycerophosphate/cardiolipin synthase-like enzyme
MQASVRDSRQDVVDQLVKMKRGGCKVWVVAHTVEPHALATLRAAHIPVHRMPIHDKAFIVYGKFGGERQYRIFTGSHNLSGGSAHRYDEIFVKLAGETGDTHPVYDAYYTHFNDAYNAGADY